MEIFKNIYYKKTKRKKDMNNLFLMQFSLQDSTAIFCEKYVIAKDLIIAIEKAKLKVKKEYPDEKLVICNASFVSKDIIK